MMNSSDRAYRPVRTSLCQLTSFAIAIAIHVNSGVAIAAPGQVELNQTCAVSTGCAAGDVPGFPIRLEASDSYVLTSDLVVPDENTTAIVINADQVSLDLAGFAIRGPGLAGIGDGIRSEVLRDEARIQNGSIVGVGRDGVAVQRRSVVRDVRVIGPGADGVRTSNSGLVLRCRVENAGGHGIDVGGSSLVIETQSHGAGGNGIRTVGGALVAESVAYQAVGIGVSGNGEGGLADNFIAENFGGGFSQQVSGFWFDLGGNYCRLNSPGVCP